MAGRAHGKNPGRKVVTTLGENEHITSVEGHATPNGRVHRLHFITTNAKTHVSKHDHLVAGGVHGDPFRWVAPPGMILIGFHVRTGSYVDQLTPIWGPTPPLRYEVKVKKVDYPEELPTKEVPVQDVGRGITRNLTQNDIKAKLTWRYTANVSSSISVIESKAMTSGYSASMEVEVSAEAFGVGASTKLGFEMHTETSNSHTAENATEKSSGREFASEQEVTIPPGYKLSHKATYTALSVSDIPWSGYLRADYGNGFYIDTPIEGKYSGSSASKLNTEFSLVKVKDEREAGQNTKAPS